MDFNENSELHKLAHQVTKLETQVIYLEKQVDENRKANDVRFIKLEGKIDELKESFAEMKGDIKALLIRIGLMGTGALIILEFVGKTLKLW